MKENSDSFVILDHFLAFLSSGIKNLETIRWSLPIELERRVAFSEVLKDIGVLPFARDRII